MIVYLPASFDLFHIGHLRAIKQCAKKGKVIIGLLSDKLIKSYKGEPVIPYEQRKEILEAIPLVYKIVKQDTLYPDLKGVDYLASGDGFEVEEVEAMNTHGVKPLRLKYCREQSSTKIKKKVYEQFK